MDSTTWTVAPAGFPSRGGLAVSPYACLPAVVGGGAGVVMAPVAAPNQGSGLPLAARLRPIDERGAAHKSFLQMDAIAVTGIAPMSTTTDNNSTTLGIHPPGRPQS